MLSGAQRDIENLQQKILDAQSANTKLFKELSEFEQRKETFENNKSIANGLITQANYEFGEEYAKGLEKESSIESKMKSIFEHSYNLTQTERQVNQYKGKYIASNGQGKESTIVEFGQIAAFAKLQAGKYIPLLPIKGGHLQQFGTDISTKLSGDSNHLYLIEGKNKSIEQRAEKTLDDFLKGAGHVGMVIIILGFVSILLIMVRALLLLKSGKDDSQKIEDITNFISKDEISNAIEAAKQNNTSIARIMKTTLENIKLEKEQLERKIREAVIKENFVIDKFGSVILVIAAVAPLMGLLGTVTGMISTFDIITEFGTGDPKLLSSGISEALITTELGLVVAIPSLLLGNILTSWSQKIKSRMEANVLRILNNYKKHELKNA